MGGSKVSPDDLAEDDPAVVVVGPVLGRRAPGRGRGDDGVELTEPALLSDVLLVDPRDGVTAGKDTLSLLMAMNFVFADDGPYNGSRLAAFGANPAERAIREMPVVGGTGMFRFARGYCQARMRWFNATPDDDTVEYNIHLCLD